MPRRFDRDEEEEAERRRRRERGERVRVRGADEPRGDGDGFTGASVERIPRRGEWLTDETARARRSRADPGPAPNDEPRGRGDPRFPNRSGPTPDDDVGGAREGLDEAGGDGDVGSSRQGLDDPGYSGPPPPEQWQRDSANLPGAGLTGAADAVADYNAYLAAERDRQVWRDLAGTEPTVDELTGNTYLESDVDEYGNLIGDPSQLEGYGATEDQQAAQRAMRELYESGGYTDADRNMARALRDQQARAMGSANAATAQQMSARGMGGSGAEIAGRMGAAEAMAGANSQADVALQQAAQQRAWAALQGHGAMSNTMQEQELARRNQLDQYNQANTDWRRGRESRNTAWTNRGEERRGAAHQQAFGNRQGVAQGITRFAPGGGGNDEGDEANERDNSILGFIEGLFQ